MALMHFFVRNDLLNNNFVISNNIMEYFQPPRYYLSGIQSGISPALKVVIAGVKIQLT